MRSRQFSLPKRDPKIKELDFVIVDVTESQIERPKKQINYYSGKKKKHTLKTQVIFSPSLNQIISIQVATGRRHDLTIARKYAKEFANFMSCFIIISCALNSSLFTLSLLSFSSAFSNKS